MIQCLYDLNDESLLNDEATRKDLNPSIAFAKLIIKKGINIQTQSIKFGYYP